jgi:hypothetical protein
LCLFASCGESAYNAFETSGGGTADTVDLSKMSSTVTYSMAMNIVYYHPTDYIGKTLIVDGVYSEKIYEDVTLRFVSLSDVTGCCFIDIEFIYEENMPSNNSKIRVVGIYERYYKGGKACYRIVASEVNDI